jgi:hypothetical protein
MAYERLSEFRYLVRCWDNGDERFEEIVECGASMLPDARRALAKEFQVADSTVDRWRNGTARPHPGIKRLVVGYLRQKLLSSE